MGYSTLVAGNSIRATVRMTGVAKNTVVKLLADVGVACAEYQNRTLRNLPCKRIQCDEIWSFVYAKQKNVKTAKAAPQDAGDAWTWTAIDADTKLVPSWSHGNRTIPDATSFIEDVAARLTHRVQITTDGHRMYLEAMEAGFGGDVDYAMLIKLFGPAGNPQAPEARYSPGECCGTSTNVISGNPDDAHVSTSFVERQNLTMRMCMRRFTRLTNAFSKKLENLMHAVSLHFMFYNFGRQHKTLRVTPAMAAGISDHIWSLEEIANLVTEPAPKPRGPYRKKVLADSN